MEFDDVVRSRRSVRDYDTKREISDTQLKQLFELVTLSPSSYNLQPWEFIVVRNKENKRRLFECTNGQKHVAEASAAVIVLGSTNPAAKAEAVISDRMKKGTMDEARLQRFTAAVDRISSDKAQGKLWATRSTSLAAMALMLAAKNMGISSCPIESFNSEGVRKEFSIPDSYEIVMIITLGYESKPAPEQGMRFGYKDIVHLEEFGKKN